MATSPSEPERPPEPGPPPPPELVAIAVALEATIFAPGADDVPPPPDVRRWRWQGWE